MKVVCDTCGRTARGTVDELIDLGWSRAMVRASSAKKKINQTFTSCPRHGRELLVALMEAFSDLPPEHRLVRLLEGGSHAA